MVMKSDAIRSLILVLLFVLRLMMVPDPGNEADVTFNKSACRERVGIASFGLPCRLPFPAKPFDLRNKGNVIPD